MPLLYPYSILHISIHVNILQAPTSPFIIPISHLLYLHSPQHITGSDQITYRIFYISIHLNKLQAMTSAFIIPISHLLYLHSPQHITGLDQRPYYTHIASSISLFTPTYCRLRPLPLLYPYCILHISIHLNRLQVQTRAPTIPISHPLSVKPRTLFTI